MKKVTSIPKHYRKLRWNEKFKSGDLYRSVYSSSMGRVSFAGIVSEWNSFVFFRRRHIKVNRKPLPLRLPLVQFLYPMSNMPWVSKLRTVSLIGADGKYLIGLERGKDREQFKKFLRKKAINFKLVEFNPDSIK